MLCPLAGITIPIKSTSWNNLPATLKFTTTCGEHDTTRVMVKYPMRARSKETLNREVMPSHRRNQGGGYTINYLRNLEDEVSTWASISVHPHRFGGREFRFVNAELG